MSLDERQFVLDIIKKYKPKKILEIGVASGANSALILDFLEQEGMLDSTKFYSFDYFSMHWDGIHNMGYMVDELVPHLRDNWVFYTGGFIANHIEKIGKNIDMCIIDTVHIAPGEILDFLMVLPFLSRRSILVMHDLSNHILWDGIYWDGYSYFNEAHVCAQLFFAWKGKKYYPKPYDISKKTLLQPARIIEKPVFQNIGCCILEDDLMSDDNLETYFRLLSIPWAYIPSDNDLQCFENFVKRYYHQKFLNYLKIIIDLQKDWNINSRVNKEKKLLLENEKVKLQNRNLQEQILIQDSDIKNLTFYKEFGRVKARIQNQLSYKLGQILIMNSKSVLGYLSLPFIILSIVISHKQEQKAYKFKVKKNPNLALPPLETYPDYNEALKEKECFTYKLGEAFIKASKNWYKGGYIKFILKDVPRLKRKLEKG
ncbi:class I SAM-dependent methyltransferase [Campylobacter jejuni]|uniref:class I SAM-dependent methyltransferase n=1 Tax=Campylobacter jejuni TaxID=197 RepID=UPI001374EFCD|nr:class I SAM-dependent methyltransferase [Campylobacter jejuni]